MSSRRGSRLSEALSLDEPSVIRVAGRTLSVNDWSRQFYQWRHTATTYYTLGNTKPATPVNTLSSKRGSRLSEVLPLDVPSVIRVPGRALLVNDWSHQFYHRHHTATTYHNLGNEKTAMPVSTQSSRRSSRLSEALSLDEPLVIHAPGKALLYDVN